jgi:hypothetical protein
MVKILKSIDLFPQKFEFTYKGKIDLSTRWGGLLTIFALFSIIINGIFLGKDIYLKEKPNVIEIVKTEKLTPTVRINKNISNLGFGFSDFTDVIEDDSLFQMIPIYYVQTLNKEDKYIYKEHLLEFENCERSENDHIYYSKCIKNFDIYLSGSWSEDSLAYLIINVRKCSNETYVESHNIETEEDQKLIDNYLMNITEYHNSAFIVDKEFNRELNLFEYLKEYEKNRNKNKTICRPQEEIDKKLEGVNYFNVLYSQIHTNPQDYKNPFTSNTNLMFFTIGNNFIKEWEVYYTNYVSELDNGIIFEEKKIDQNKIGIDKVDKDMKITKNDNDLAYLSFYMGKKIIGQKKSYIKLPTIAANLGGFINLTFLLLELISLPYFQMKKNLKIINEFFDLNEKDDIFREKRLSKIKIKIK